MNLFTWDPPCNQFSLQMKRKTEKDVKIKEISTHIANLIATRTRDGMRCEKEMNGNPICNCII